jgi:antitoxin (DNA-binding transcriptional repressor) of toxin-antitoxin stability system
MKENSFTELRNQARHFFDRVESGETVRMLRNGRAIAEVHPVAHDLPSWKRRKARRQLIGGEAISKLLLAERGH